MAITLDGSDNKIAIGANATGSAYVRLYEDTDNGTNYVDIIAPASITSNRTLTLPDNTGTILTSTTAGSVLQVLSATKTDTLSTTSTTMTDVTGLSVSITPSSASNKILVCCFISVGAPNTNFAYINLVRGSTAICIGNTASNRPTVTGMSFSGVTNEGVMNFLPITFLDSPSTTSSTTYKIQIRCATAGNAYINRSSRDQDLTSNDVRTASTITVMEIAA
jgi:hypothetical protein